MIVACRLGLLAVLNVSMSACGVLPKRDEEQAAGQATELTDSKAPESEVAVRKKALRVFTMGVKSAGRNVIQHLKWYLDIQGFNCFPDSQPAELNRLMAEADANARSLLVAQGYFNPELSMRLEEMPAGSKTLCKIVIEMELGLPSDRAGDGVALCRADE